MNSSTSDRTADSSEVELLRELVELESPSFDLAASARIAEIIAARFARIGASVRSIPTEAGTNLVIDAPGDGAPLLLVGHTDTVWPVGTLATNVPWADDGRRIAGPGAYDMKSGIVVMHAALARLAGRKHHAVRIVLTCDEEVGSPTTQSLLRELALDARGALGFESPHPDGALKIGRRGSSRVRLTVDGRESHAALDPELGVSAIDELVDQLLRIRAITSADDLPSPVLCNVGTVHGGARTNVVPDHATAEIGLRFVEPVAEKRVLAGIRGLTPIRPGARLDFDVLSHRPAWLPSDADRALLAEVCAVAAGIGQTLTGRPASGAGDTNLLGSLGIPTLDGFGPRGGGAHAESEHVLAASLFERIDLLAAILTSTEQTSSFDT